MSERMCDSCIHKGLCKHENFERMLITESCYHFNDISNLFELPKEIHLQKFDEECLLMTFEPNHIPMDNLERIYHKIQEFFPNNQVLAIPSEVYLQKLNKEELLRIVVKFNDFVTEVIKNGKD